MAAPLRSELQILSCALSAIEAAEGREVKLVEFLEKVREVVARTALQQVLGTAEARARNSAAGALEEDARLTAGTASVEELVALCLKDPRDCHEREDEMQRPR